MAKSPAQTDVLVVGDHPCAYLAAALLKQSGSLQVTHTTSPGEQYRDRLVLINPLFFDLHPILAGLKRKLELTPIYGLKFLADDPSTSNSLVNKTIGAYVGSFKQIHSMMVKLAEEAGVQFYRPAELQIGSLDETGLQIQLDRRPQIHPKLLILAADLPAGQKRILGLPIEWEHQTIHRYTFLKLKNARMQESSGKAVVPMSLDLRGTLNWAWLLPGATHLQLAIEQPIETVQQYPPAQLLSHWASVLAAHGVLKSGSPIDPAQAEFMDLPLGGALSQEGVANRTLLIGPAGGFYTACAEDIYPNCWSAVHAAEVARKALMERHLQDALQPYRLQWGATLGDYLRGPQQNLRFLLPLVYRNPTMTARLVEAILSGKSVVR